MANYTILIEKIDHKKYKKVTKHVFKKVGGENTKLVQNQVEHLEIIRLICHELQNKFSFLLKIHSLRLFST